MPPDHARFDIADFPDPAMINCKMPWPYLFELISDGRTPVRALSDTILSDLSRYLTGNGTIYELGAAGNGYKHFFKTGQRYITANINNRADIVIDMTNMNFEDSSIDAYISMFAIEHVLEHQKAIQEMKRTLKPGGRVLLAAPFLQCYHAAPDDYVRFTSSYLKELFSDFTTLTLPVGNRALSIAQMYHIKPWIQNSHSKISVVMYRLLSALFTASYCARPISDHVFAPAFFILAEKKPD